MSKVTIWKRDVAEEMKKAYKSKALPNIKGYVVELSLNDDILDALDEEDDRVTPQRMVEDAQDLCEATVKTLNAKLREMDKDLDGGTEDEAEKAMEEFEKFLEKELKSLGDDLKKVPAARWSKFVATKKQYKTYKVDVGFKVTLGVLGAIGSGLAIAAAIPTGGATLAFGIVGGIRSGLACIKIAADLYKEMETVQKSVESNLKTLGDLYKSKGKLAAAETGSTAINSIFGADFAPNVKRVESDVKLWSDKVARADVNGHDAAAKAIKALKDIDKLKKIVKKSASKEAGVIMTKIEGLEKKVDDALTKAEDMNARVGNGEKGVEAAEDLLAELDKSVPDLQKAFNKLFPIVTSGALAVVNATDGFTSAKTAMDYYSTSLDLASNVLEMIQEQIPE